jgi:calcium binding protein
MVEDATVDCYDEDEAATGFFSMFENELALPFGTRVLGVDVTVENIDVAGDGSIMVICARDGIRQAIRIVDLPLPEPPPAGAEWIAAYRYWLG